MEIFQKSAFSSKDPAKNKRKLNKKQPCLTHKILFVCLMMTDSFTLLYALKNSGLPLHSGEQLHFRLEYRVQELIEHTFFGSVVS